MNGRDAPFAVVHRPAEIAPHEDYVALYCERTRQTIPAPQFYIAYNLFPGSGITQGIMKRALKGTASSEHAVEMAIAHEKSPTSRGPELKKL